MDFSGKVMVILEDISEILNMLKKLYITMLKAQRLLITDQGPHQIISSHRLMRQLIF